MLLPRRAAAAALPSASWVVSADAPSIFSATRTLPLTSTTAAAIWKFICRPFSRAAETTFFASEISTESRKRLQFIKLSPPLQPRLRNLKAKADFSRQTSERPRIEEEAAGQGVLNYLENPLASGRGGSLREDPQPRQRVGGVHQVAAFRPWSRDLGSLHS